MRTEFEQRQVMLHAVEKFEKEYNTVLVDFRKSNKFPVPQIEKQAKRVSLLSKIFGSPYGEWWGKKKDDNVL